VVFSHNDLQYGNILRLSESGELVFLDFEYAGTNYVEYDFANHFCEWMADYHSSRPHALDPNLYPTQDVQYDFITQYINTQKKFGYPVADAKAIMDRMPYFTAISHLLWGFWGIFRGASLLNIGSDFDYLAYGLGRIRMYGETRSLLVL
jgi:choline/ethanolamine kinase